MGERLEVSNSHLEKEGMTNGVRESPNTKRVKGNCIGLGGTWCMDRLCMLGGGFIYAAGMQYQRRMNGGGY